MSLRKLVITSIKDGAKTRSVRTIRTFKELTKSAGSVGADIDRSTLGNAVLSAPKRVNVNMKSNR